MLKKISCLLIIILFCHLTVKANFDFNTNCINAYQAILDLRIPEAKALIIKERQQNPQNGITILLDNYADYFNLLASDNKGDYERLKNSRSGRITALEANNHNSPYYLFAQAQIYLQSGLCKGRFGEYLSSALDIKKASSLIKDNDQKFPDFLPNGVGKALVNVIFGSIPPNLKSVTRFLGMGGNAELGVKQLETIRFVLPKSKFAFLKDEVIFYLCYIDIDVLRNRNNYAKLISYTASMDSKSLLKAYLQGYDAFKTAHNDEVIDFLQNVPSSSQYVALPSIYFLLGNAKLNRMDNDAPAYFNRYLRDYKGSNFIKDSYLKLAWFYLLHNETDKYEYYVRLVRSKGFATDEKDKQALREANDVKPDIDLLTARLYFDGGYYSKALLQLKSKDMTSLKIQRDKLEYYYRLGRIDEKTDNYSEALNNYQNAVNLGKKTNYYFAANAAVRMGNIFERKKESAQAIRFYRQALDMPDHEYKQSIDNEAKEGLKRLGQ